MSSFARSFKAPSFLSAHRRPGMSGRTISNSSDLSLSSNHNGVRSDDASDLFASGPTTPSVPSGDERGLFPDQDTEIPDASSASSSRLSRSHPIAIELPKVKRFTTSANPPPEELSARGDLPGGYFPLHEDPRIRIYRPHPFHQDTGLARSNLTASPVTMPLDHDTSRAPPTPPTAQANIPVASYLPAGFHDTPLPMGKYYPSNYEQHHKAANLQGTRPSVADALPSSIKSESQLPHYATESARPGLSDSETRRKMQQYQRDMVAQVAMALGSTSSKSGAKLGSGTSLKSMALKDIWLNSPMPRKPISPRLLPLGSPGPVTPMELESTAGGYLDKGRSQERRMRESQVPPGAGFTAHSM